jgi:hypothetical protein
MATATMACALLPGVAAPPRPVFYVTRTAPRRAAAAPLHAAASAAPLRAPLCRARRAATAAAARATALPPLPHACPSTPPLAPPLSLGGGRLLRSAALALSAAPLALLPALAARADDVVADAASGAPPPDDLVTTLLFTLAIVFLVILTGGVVYLSYCDFMDRQAEARACRTLHTASRLRSGCAKVSPAV